MYVPQILPQASPIPIQPLSTSAIMAQPPQPLSYMPIAQPQYQTMSFINPIPAPMPVYQPPPKLAIPYERFIPPIPKASTINENRNVIKVYQFYQYVPVVQNAPAAQQPIQQQVQTVVPGIQTAYSPMTIPNYQVIQ